MADHKQPPPVFAIDPGPEESAWVQIKGDEICREIWPNDKIFGLFYGQEEYTLAIEMIASYGMPVGEEVFETCVWIGRFIHAWRFSASDNVARVYRKDVKMHLCGQPRAKDSNIRQVLIDRFGPGRDRAIGTKKNPGPLYGFKKDMWAALAVAVTWQDQQGMEGNEQ